MCWCVCVAVWKYVRYVFPGPIMYNTETFLIYFYFSSHRFHTVFSGVSIFFLFFSWTILHTQLWTHYARTHTLTNRMKTYNCSIFFYFYFFFAGNSYSWTILFGVSRLMVFFSVHNTYFWRRNEKLLFFWFRFYFW